jgi:hypothetical protein
LKKVAIIQPNFIPWVGYFKFIADVDEFIFLDDVQYTKRDWRNRNKIRIPEGWKWLTLAVDLEAGSRIPINEIKFSKHVNVCDHTIESISQFYSKSKCLAQWLDLIKESFEKSEGYLSKFNVDLLKKIMEYLGIETPTFLSSSYNIKSESSLKLIELMKIRDGSIYVSGTNAKAYLDESMFNQNNISIQWYKYTQPSPYLQLYDGYVPNLSVLDLILNEGDKSKLYFN